MCEILNLSAICRCCHTDGQFKSLRDSYTYQNQVEVYWQLLQSTFDITIQDGTLKEASYSICDECIVRVRDATRFKIQVINCERKFLEYCKNELASSSGGIKVEVDFCERDDYVEPSSPLLSSKDEEISISNGSMKHEDIDSEIDEKSIKDEDSQVKIEVAQTIDTTQSQKKDNKVMQNVKAQKQPPLVLRRLEEINDFVTQIATGYNCNICDEKSTNLAAMFDHIPSAHNRVYYEQFFRKIKTEDGVEFTCKSCDEKFVNNKLSYKIHSCKDNRNTKCDMCEVIVHGDRYNVRQHYRRNHGGVPLKCSYCDKTFTNWRYLKTHEKTHSLNKVFKCDICLKEFRYKQTLRRHIGWHNGTNKKYMCEACGKAFNDVTNLNKHRDTVHLKLRRFACDQCPKTFTAKKHLKHHIETHSGEKFACAVCTKAFANRLNLKAHQKLHDPNRKFECQQCTKKFRRRGDYARHLKVHAGDRVLPYNCEMCPKSFLTKYAHKRHMEYHYDLKKYPCDICNKNFSTRDVMRNHKNTVHDPKRNSIVKTKCEICKHLVSNFSKHMEQHVNRPFKCNLCPNTFHRKGSLNRHVKTRHIDVSFVNCDVCGKKYRGEHCLKKHKFRVHKMSIKSENYDNMVPAFEIPIETEISIV